MSAPASSLTAFHRVGDRSGLDAAKNRREGMQPALFANYRDFSKIRHDFPVVLLEDPADGVWVRSLTDIVNAVLRGVAAPGSGGEATRNQVLRLEQEIRGLLAEGQAGSLSLLWETARRRMMGDEAGPDPSPQAQALERNLAGAREALDVDGEVLDCGPDLAARLIGAAWRVSEDARAAGLQRRVVRLAQKLNDILEADFAHSERAREPDQLESSMGSANQSVFDFQAMAKILRTAPRARPLPAQRVQRIRDAIDVLKNQRFVSIPGDDPRREAQTFDFHFTDPAQAIAAYRERLPAMAELVRAISIAQLEIENRYEEERHDDFFAGFDKSRLGPSDLARFPAYLLCVSPAGDQDLSALLDILRMGLPFNIVAQLDDILDQDDIDSTRLAFGARGQQLARMAVGLDRVFVMQAASSSLYRLEASVFRGLQADFPALFSIYTGQADFRSDSSTDSGHQQTTPHYLMAAAATESRVFPNFTYDPSAGKGQASRFSLEGNPRVGQDWAVHPLSFEDGEHNRQTEKLSFTPADFIGAFARFSERFVCVGREDWDDDMVPLTDYLALDSKQRAHKVPYILMMDHEAILQRAVFDTLLVDAVERCLEGWDSLKEMAGFDNSHVARALSELEPAREDQKAQPAEAPTAAEPAATPKAEAVADTAKATDETAEATVEESAEPASGEPWIETIRCTTCNECKQINDRMFAYNEDQRAYIADPDAGTYRELVEAAESCQVAIIHPGQPRNPDEPGLEELVERAAPFN